MEFWGEYPEDVSDNFPMIDEDYKITMDLWIPNTQAGFRKCKKIIREIRRSSRKGKVYIRCTQYHGSSEYTSAVLALKTGKVYEPVSEIALDSSRLVHDVILFYRSFSNELFIADKIPPRYGVQSMRTSIDFTSQEFGLLTSGIANDVVYYFDKLADHLNKEFTERDNVINSLLDFFKR